MRLCQSVSLGWLLLLARTGVAQALNAPPPHGSVAEAHRLVDAGDFHRAESLLLGIVGAEPKSAAAHEMLAYTYLRLDNPKRSLEEYTAAAAIEHPSAVDLQNVAKDYVLLGDTASADHWMNSALKMNDKDAEAWYGMGRIRFTEQRFQDAVACFQRSLLLLPRGVKAENNLGLSYEGLDRIDDAVTAYRQAIEWQTGDPHPSEQPFLNLGIVLVHQGKLDEAEKMLTQAVAIAPNDERIHEELGHLDQELNRLPEAEHQLEAAVALEPGKASLHFLLGKVYRQEGKEEKSKAEFALSSSLSGYHSTPEK